MKKAKQSKKKTKDYYPLVNPHRIVGPADISEPSEEDIEAAKSWVDDTQK